MNVHLFICTSGLVTIHYGVVLISEPINFHFIQDFVIGLSILLRGSLDDKLRWTFTLYDQDRDGFISR